jgi:hypothetical protein
MEWADISEYIRKWKDQYPYFIDGFIQFIFRTRVKKI